MKTTKIIAGALAIASTMAMNPTGANAAWKQNSTGWWYTEGNSWAIGWRLIDGDWYYFHADGYMAKNESINGYYVDSNGVWTQRKLTLEDAVNLIKNNKSAYDWIETDRIDTGHFVEEIDSNSTNFKIGSTNVFDVIGHNENLYNFSFGVLSIYIGTTSGKVYISTGGSGVVTFSLVEGGQEVKTWMRSRETKLDGNGNQIGWNYDTPLKLCTMNY